MVNRTQAGWAVAGIVVSVPIVVLLIQSLSVDLAEMQLRDRFLGDGQSVAQLAIDFELPRGRILTIIGCRNGAKAPLTATLARVAAACGVSIDDAKRRIAHAALTRPAESR